MKKYSKHYKNAHRVYWQFSGRGYFCTSDVISFLGDDELALKIMKELHVGGLVELISIDSGGDLRSARWQMEIISDESDAIREEQLNTALLPIYDDTKRIQLLHQMQ